MQELVERQAVLANADGQQAVRMVREHAAEWGIAPDRIGIMGFSAGAHVAGGVALQHESDSRPDFAAVIYGALREQVVVPPDAPPLFIALANNDEITTESSLCIYSAWKEAGHPVEMHSYAVGGHGFGMRKQGLPCDSWIDRLGDWLHMQGLL
jgi:acetyl esterase/lipase